MADEDNASQDQTPTRLRLGRSRRAAGGGGFSGGSMARTESLRLTDESSEPNIGDDVDTILDPEEMQRNILRHSRANPAEPSPGMPSPGDRLHDVSLSGSESYSKEYRMVLLHRMLMRRVPLDQIAQQLRVSVSTIQKDRAELKQFLRERARQLNINELIGGQMGVYDELAGMAMRIAGAAQGEGAQPAAMRLAAMRTVLAAEADRTRFLNSAGVFDAMPFRRGEDGSDTSDVQRLMDRTSDLLERLSATDDAAELPPKRVRRTTKGEGFGPMSLNDKDASSGDAEHIEL